MHISWNLAGHPVFSSFTDVNSELEGLNYCTFTSTRLTLFPACFLKIEDFHFFITLSLCH
uniref:Uncharacterized protein n=1 Tax=Anguilla anguilla TaxID=7936 RepID=A0A0E9WJN2_ANGAN